MTFAERAWQPEHQDSVYLTIPHMLVKLTNMPRQHDPHSHRTTMTAAEAKAHFAESLRLAESGDVVEITRYGKPVAALVGAQTLDQLDRLLAGEPQQGLQSLVGRWDDGDEFADALDSVVAGRSRMRELPDIET